jgi:hypothetical protein
MQISSPSSITLQATGDRLFGKEWAFSVRHRAATRSARLLRSRPSVPSISSTV